MIIIEDSRNQKDKHKNINEWFEKNGIQVVRTKLFIGDYARIDNLTICIDTKKDVLEIAGNICGSQHERFRNECLRAQQCGIKLIILIEELYDLDIWVSPKNKKGKALSKVNGKTLKKAMNTMSQKYGVEFIFCDKNQTAEKIYKILNKA